MDHQDSACVDVWTWALDADAPELERLAVLLSATELSRAQRFFRAQDRDRWIVAHGRMRELLALVLGVSNGALEFDVEPQERPVLKGAASALSFNLSHSRNVAALALSFDARVGVDIEAIRPIGDDEIAWALSPLERNALNTVARQDRLDAFFRFWTLKEAFMKGVGLGAALPLHDFDMALVGPELLRWAGHDEEVGRWVFEEAAPVPGMRAALAAQTDGRRLLTTWRCA